MHCLLLHLCKQTPEDVRRQLFSSWLDHLKLEYFDFKRFLASESEQLQWKIEGLPADQLSVENACVVLQVSYMSACIYECSAFGSKVKGHGVNCVHVLCIYIYTSRYHSDTGDPSTLPIVCPVPIAGRPIAASYPVASEAPHWSALGGGCPTGHQLHHVTGAGHTFWQNFAGTRGGHA